MLIAIDRQTCLPVPPLGAAARSKDCTMPAGGAFAGMTGVEAYATTVTSGRRRPSSSPGSGTT